MSKENIDLEQQEKSSTFKPTYENVDITVVWTAHQQRTVTRMKT